MLKGFTQKFDKNKIKGKIYSEYVTKELEYDSPKGEFQGYKVEGKLLDFLNLEFLKKEQGLFLLAFEKRFS